jgi:hypothetical protein
MLALAATFALALAGCNGGSSSVPGFGTTNGYFRFVNASADAGPVDIYVDGQHITGPGTNGVIPYGGITAFNKFSVGSHQIVVNAGGTQTALTGIPAQALTQSLNGNSYETIALVGEVHPTVSSDTLNLILFNDTLFSTSSGGMAVNFHNAAPAVPNQPVQFGYYYINTPTTTATLGSPVPVGGLTQPTGVPSSALNANIQVGFYGGSPTAYTITPSQIDPTGCAANTLPCNSGSLNLYLIDGPAASTSPTAGPYPAGITASSMAGFVGIFDANNT